MNDGFAGTHAALNVRQVQRVATRGHLVSAARSAFEEKGYGETTIDDILLAAGASRATFYSHFGGKSQVAIEVFREAMKEVEGLYHQLDEALSGGEREDFQHWIGLAIDWMRDRARLAPVFEQAAFEDPEFRALRREFLDQIPRWMPGYVASWPEPDRWRGELRIQLLVTLLLAYCRRPPSEKVTDEERQILVGEITAVWYSSLLPHAGAREQL